MGIHEFGVSLQEVIEELFCGNNSTFVANPFAVKPVLEWIGVGVVEALPINSDDGTFLDKFTVRRADVGVRVCCEVNVCASFIFAVVAVAGRHCSSPNMMASFVLGCSPLILIVYHRCFLSSTRERVGWWPGSMPGW